LKNTWHLYINFKSWLLLELKFWWLCCILGCFLFLKKLDTEINFYQDCIVLANVYQDTVKKLDNVKLIFSGTEIFVALVELKNGHSLGSQIVVQFQNGWGVWKLHSIVLCSYMY
jgi:hypothetical protein